jgi:DNA-directed RNA polymerase specialized sigma24 family protein
MKQKVKFQNVRDNNGGPDYEAHNAQAQFEGTEATQANPDTLLESAAYWHVDEATKEVQARVRLMLERAKQVLTDQQYNAFVLVDLKKLKLRDAAKVMEINYQRVDQLVKRARLKLQKVYEETADHV